MAKDESFLLLSLSDSKAKKIAQVVSNESCKKILDYLSKTKSATETQVSKDLKIPLPTAHYNLKQLVEVKLVDINEYHYSEKGKEVNHYSLANKYIIIAPRQEASLTEKLKKLLPAFAMVIAGSALIKLIEIVRARTFRSFSEKAATDTIADAAPRLMMAQEAAPIANSWVPGIATWFFIGGVSALLIYLIVDWIKEK